VKKTFTIITVLITISLLGIIFIQLSWLKNMILLKQEQIKSKVERAVIMVGEELAQYKGNYLSNKISSSNTIFPDDFAMELLRPVTIGRRFTAAELQEKIKKAFKSLELDKVKFEFMLATISPRTEAIGKIELQSKNFLAEYEDSINNFSRAFSLFAPSGSAAENLAADESLVVTALDWKDAAISELRLRIITAILFTIIIITAFYLTVRTMLRQKKLGEIKNDFINNMTHEFKTPIATISLVISVLLSKRKISG
jgi:two-component system, OmpR family, phosphate regulon sensor histidine kinase PhoR